VSGVKVGTVCRWTVGALMLLRLSLLGQTISARATVDSTSFLIGDAIPIHLLLTHPPGATLTPLFADTVGGFTVLGRPALTPENDTTTTGEVVVAKYDSGEALLPPLPVFVHLPGERGAQKVATNELRLTVRTVPVDTSQGIRDVKPPIHIPLPWWEILLALGGVLVLGAVLYLLYRWWKKRRSVRSGETPPLPVRPAHLIAFEELGQLREKRLWQQGLIKLYYSEATEIFRRYMENRYRLMALERTTEEILEDLQRLRMTDELLRKAEDLLRRADLVKFAKHQPPVTEHEASLQTVYDFVEQTKIVPPATGAEGRSHVGA
jgi:hypothetical protein